MLLFYKFIYKIIIKYNIIKIKINYFFFVLYIHNLDLFLCFHMKKTNNVRFSHDKPIFIFCIINIIQIRLYIYIIKVINKINDFNLIFFIFYNFILFYFKLLRIV